jgi:hypothetical protein
MAEQGAQEQTATAWRVATIGHDPSDLWRVRQPEFESKQDAWEWALNQVWEPQDKSERARTCYLVPVVEGYPVVPAWMAERMHPLED